MTGPSHDDSSHGGPSRKSAAKIGKNIFIVCIVVALVLFFVASTCSKKTAPANEGGGQVQTSIGQPVFQGGQLSAAPQVDVANTEVCKGAGMAIKMLGKDESVIVRAPSKTSIYWFRTDTHESLGFDAAKFCNGANPGDCASAEKPLRGAIPRFVVTNTTASPYPIACEYDPES